jgi:hypothetical protein
MALVLVVVVIAALVAIAAPFVISMRLHEKSARGFASRIRARRLAEAARNDAVAALLATHPDEERRARLARQDIQGDDEDWDSLDEVSPKARDLDGQYHLAAHGTKDSTMLDVGVRDERSKIDLNSSANAVANLFGTTVTTDVLDIDETKILPVADVTPFYSDEDPNTVDGGVYINGEIILYRHVQKNPPALVGLIRGAYFTSRPPSDEPNAKKIQYPAGSLVQDFRVAKIARDAIWRFYRTDREGELARFETPSALRKIAEWDLGDAMAAEFLHGNGVTFEKLKEWGVGADKLEKAGLDPTSLDGKKQLDQSAADEAKHQEEAEKGLQKLGVDPALLRRFLGEHGVTRTWDTLRGLEEDQQHELAKSWIERLEKMSEREMKHMDFWRPEVRRQFDEMIAMHEKTPELETIGRIELERIRPWITVDAPHDGEQWTEPQVVNHAVRYDLNEFATLRVQDGRRFRSGMLIRLRAVNGKPGDPIAPPTNFGPPEFRRCVGVRQVLDHTEIRIFPELERDYEAGQIELSGLLPRPVNVNAAPREVLIAVLTGLQVRVFQHSSATGQTAPNFVTPDEAAAVADRLLAQPLHSTQDLKALLDKAVTDTVIDAGDEEAILLNSIDPANPILTRSTVPFCYSSGDTYEVTSTGIINDDASNEVARVKTREIVQVAPPRDLVWTLDSQADLIDRIATRGGLQVKTDPRSFTPAYIRGRWEHLLETFPQDLFAAPWLPVDRLHAGPAEVKVAIGRDWDQPPSAMGPQANGALRAPGVTYFEHYDNEREGHKLEGGIVTIAGATLPTRSFTVEDGSRRVYLGPGTVRGWFEVDKIAGDKTYLFDAGVDEVHNRISLWYDNKAKEIVATVRDETLDSLETGGNPRPNAEVRAPLTLKPQNWYHAALAWKGSERGDLAIVVDGKPVGTDTTGTTITTPIDTTALVIAVKSTASFPDHGFIKVGGFRHQDSTLGGDTFTDNDLTPGWTAWQPYSEVLYYASKTATTFNIAPAPNQWGVQFRNRHQNDDPLPPDPPGSDDPIRQPIRGTGRFSLIEDPGFWPRFAVRRGFFHDIGTPVTLWGYTVWLKNGVNLPTRSFSPAPNESVQLPPKLPTYQETIRQGSATLTDPLPENTPFTLVYKPNPVGWNKADPIKQRPAVVQPTDTTIPVVWAAPYPDAGQAGTGGFPPQGFIRIGNERMYYTGIAPAQGGIASFIVPLQNRGLDGSLPQIHYLWEPVVLESMRISSDQDYPDRNTLYDMACYVQLTPNFTQAMTQTNEDPRTGPQVEWVSIMKNPPPFGPTSVLLSAVVPDSVPQPVQPNKPYLAPGERFVMLPPQRVGGRPAPWIDIPLRNPNDTRWLAALEALFTQMNGTLPPNPGNMPIAVTATPPPAPPVGKAALLPPRRQPPPLPAEVRPLKEWLKRVEANQSRAKHNTQQQNRWKRWDPTTWQYTSSGGGRAHLVGEKIVPTFYLGTTHPGNTIDLESAGKGDVVTVCDDTAPAREEHTILWVDGTDAGTNSPPVGPTFGGDSGTGLIAAFDDFVSRQYLGSAHARLVKFPSGQLPTTGAAGPPTMAVGASSIANATGGALQGKVDELIMTQEDEPSVYEDTLRSAGQNWPALIANGDAPPLPLGVGDAVYPTCLKPNAALNTLIRGGMMMRMDDEIIGINELDATSPQGQGCKLIRGLLGTVPAAHGPECTFWWKFPFPRLAVAELGFSPPYEDQIALRARVGNQPLHDNDFYVAIDRGQGQGILEVMPIRTQRKSFLLRPRDRFDRGCFRASFGSGVVPGGPGVGEILIDWPFRYHDRYSPNQSSLEGVFFQGTKELAGAYFQSITWDATLPNTFSKLLVAVRVDGAPDWDSPPARNSEPGQPGKLYVFDDPKADNKILIRGDRVEFRVYATLKAKALENDAWKQTPVLKAVRITYRQPMRVKRREEMIE